MGKNPSKIYTRAGDEGTTRLGDGTTVEKDHIRIAACGSLDELSSALGVVQAEELPGSLGSLLATVQRDILALGTELSHPGHEAIHGEHVTRLEEELDALDEQLEPLGQFLLPGGTRAAAACHLARSICRRAERVVVTLSGEYTVSPAVLRYLNRLSDLLFVVARTLNKEAGVPDTPGSSGRQGH